MYTVDSSGLVMIITMIIIIILKLSSPLMGFFRDNNQIIEMKRYMHGLKSQLVDKPVGCFKNKAEDLNWGLRRENIQVVVSSGL